MNTIKLHTAIRFILSAVFCAVLVACASEVEPISRSTLSPTSGDATTTLTSVPTNTLTIAPSKTPTPTPVENQIAFFSKGGGSDEKTFLMRMNPDGSELTRLVEVTYKYNLRNGLLDSFSWSPDGSWIAYASSEDGDYDIYAVDVEGTIKIKLTDTVEDERFPSWSPDGRYIAYGVKQTAHVLDLETMLSQQIFEVTNAVLLNQFTWSPDSEILTYTAQGQSFSYWQINGHLASKNFNSVGKYVPYSGLRIGSLTWSPSGDRFVHWANIGYDGSGIYGFSISARGESKLISAHSDGDFDRSFDIDWSPDGTAIIYSAGTSENYINRWDIYRIGPNGENRTRLTEYSSDDTRDRGGNHNPIWSQDGSKIAYIITYVLNKAYVDDIMIMNPDGSEQTNLTNDPRDYWHLQWQPIRQSMNIHLSKKDGIPNPTPRPTNTPWPTAGPTETPRPTPTEVVMREAVEDIVIDLKGNNFECNLQFDESAGEYTAYCSRDNKTLGYYYITIYFNSKDRINYIDAEITGLSETTLDNILQDFFVYIGALPFLDQPSIQDEVKRELINYDLEQSSELVVHGFVIQTNPRGERFFINIESLEK